MNIAELFREEQQKHYDNYIDNDPHINIMARTVGSYSALANGISSYLEVFHPEVMEEVVQFLQKYQKTTDETQKNKKTQRQEYEAGIERVA